MDLENTLKTIIIGPTPEPKLSSTAVRGLLYQQSQIKFAEGKLIEGKDVFGHIDIADSKIPFRKI